MWTDKCNCSKYGFCKTFNRIFSARDWNWCRNTTKEERQDYFDLLKKAPDPEEKDIEVFAREYKGDPDLFYLYYLTLSKRHNYCSLAHKYQEYKNSKIVSYINNQERKINNFDNVEILCLGHSQKQFDLTEDRPYLRKVHLDTVDAGEYSTTKWAESRIFIPNDLFSSKSEWVGFVSASWNIKYEAFSKIHDFHNWLSASILINSKPEDKVVLCADIFCPCVWFQSEHNVLSVFFPKEIVPIIGNRFLRTVGLKQDIHVKVPFSNTFIAHRSLWQEYKDYLEDNNIFEKLDHFIDTYAQQYLGKGEAVYASSRVGGYFIEMLTCFWFASHPDFMFIPNGQRRLDWYNAKKAKQRAEEWSE